MEDLDDEAPSSAAQELLRRKVKETLELDLDSPELMDALEVVAEMWTDGNTAENRRNLRSDLERRTVEQAEAFVEHYRPLRDALAGSEAMAAELEAHVAATAGELRELHAAVLADLQRVAKYSWLHSWLCGWLYSWLCSWLYSWPSGPYRSYFDRIRNSVKLRTNFC